MSGLGTRGAARCAVSSNRIATHVATGAARFGTYARGFRHVDGQSWSRPGRAIAVELRGSLGAPKGPRHVSQVSFLGCRPWSPTWPLSGLLEPPRERGEAAQLRTLRLRSSPWWPRAGRLGLPGAWFSVPAWSQSPPGYGCESGSSCEPQVYTPPGLGPPRVRRGPSSKRWLPGGLRADFQALRASAEWIPSRSPSRPRWGPRENVELRRRDCNSLTVTRLAFEGRGEWAGVLGVFKLVE